MCELAGVGKCSGLNLHLKGARRSSRDTTCTPWTVSCAICITLPPELQKCLGYGMGALSCLWSYTRPLLGRGEWTVK